MTAVSIKPALRAGFLLVGSGLCGFFVPWIAQAQDYVDVEAERRAAEQAMATEAAPLLIPPLPTPVYGLTPVRLPWRNPPRRLRPPSPVRTLAA